MKEQLKNLNLSTWISQADTEKIEKVADNYAIEFAKWIFNEEYNLDYWLNNADIKELLEIYKKEIEKL